MTFIGHSVHLEVESQVSSIIIWFFEHAAVFRINIGTRKKSFKLIFNIFHTLHLVSKERHVLYVLQTRPCVFKLESGSKVMKRYA